MTDKKVSRVNTRPSSENSYLEKKFIRIKHYHLWLGSGAHAKWDFSMWHSCNPELDFHHISKKIVLEM